MTDWTRRMERLRLARCRGAVFTVAREFFRRHLQAH
jgi:hypothetical protein